MLILGVQKCACAIFYAFCMSVPISIIYISEEHKQSFKSKQATFIILCVALFRWGKFVNRSLCNVTCSPPCHRREGNKLKIKENILWDFHILGGEEFFERLQFEVCTDQICSWGGKQGKCWGTRIALQRKGIKIKNQKVKEIFKKRERTKTGGNTDFFAKRRENRSRRN